MSSDPASASMRLSTATEIASMRRIEDADAPTDEVFAEIVRVGFRAYVEDMQKEKIEAMREQILARMGLTEEDLDGMPSAQRQAIEDMISAEIRQRLSAENELDRDPASGGLSVADLPSALQGEAGTGGPSATTTGLSAAVTGNGLLLMLQETEAAEAGRTPLEDDSTG